MGNMIDDLLELARVSRTQLNKKPVNLSDLATCTIKSLKETDPHRFMESVISDGLITQGDKQLLMLLMANLLGNAWKYTSKNPAAKIEFGKVVDAGQEIFYVRDNGVGFDMAYSDKLFGVFQRLHGSEFEGNGIGLATVKRIVDRHRGRIWAESKLGEGATFYFTL
jgi:light-regulated signal transduction histidine kinase (bacteriophytochrome)